MKTKQDLLNKMVELDACREAMDYVQNSPDSASAEDIWRSCTRVSWLCWFAFWCAYVDVRKRACARSEALNAITTSLANTCFSNTNQKIIPEELHALWPWIVDACGRE